MNKKNMKLKKHFSFTNKKQIWRLMISNSNLLIIETRDTDKKEVHYHCYDLLSGKKIFKDFQFEEKFWIGIEAVYDNMIIFHKFGKPDMPEHKQIIAFDIATKKIIWQDKELSFLTILENKIYAFKQMFEGRMFFALDIATGDIIEELGTDVNKVHPILYAAREAENFSEYKYPEKKLYDMELNIEQIIEKETSGYNLVENVELMIFDDLLFFNFHSKKENNLIDNKFAAYNITKNKKLLSTTINKGLNAYVQDSFFCYKNLLLLLKNKNELEVFKIV